MQSNAPIVYSIARSVCMLQSYPPPPPPPPPPPGRGFRTPSYCPSLIGLTLGELPATNLDDIRRASLQIKGACMLRNVHWGWLLLRKCLPYAQAHALQDHFVSGRIQYCLPVRPLLGNYCRVLNTFAQRYCHSMRICCISSDSACCQ